MRAFARRDEALAESEGFQPLEHIAERKSARLQQKTVQDAISNIRHVTFSLMDVITCVGFTMVCRICGTRLPVTQRYVDCKNNSRKRREKEGEEELEEAEEGEEEEGE